VARSAFIEDKTPLKATQGWLTIAPNAGTWLPEVDGYNLSYLRNKATGGVVSMDEYKAPLVSFWPKGAGRVATVLFPIAGEFSGKVRAWEGYGDFLQTLTRWTVGQEMPPGTQLKTRVDGTELTIEFYYGPAWEEKIATRPPKLLLSESTSLPGATSLPPREHVWQRIAPGRYEAKVNLNPSSIIRGSVLIDKEAVPFGPIVAGGNPEWAVDRNRIVELQNTSALSGGVQRLDLSEIWNAPRDPGSIDIRPWFLWLALGTLVLDILWTRIGWHHRWPWQPGRKPPGPGGIGTGGAGTGGNSPTAKASVPAGAGMR
jgi:hypothetical protein